MRPCVYLPIPLQTFVLERNNLYPDAPVHFPQSRPTLEQPRLCPPQLLVLGGHSPPYTWCNQPRRFDFFSSLRWVAVKRANLSRAWYTCPLLAFLHKVTPKARSTDCWIRKNLPHSCPLWATILASSNSASEELRNHDLNQNQLPACLEQAQPVFLARDSKWPES